MTSSRWRATFLVILLILLPGAALAEIVGTGGQAVVIPAPEGQALDDLISDDEIRVFTEQESILLDQDLSVDIAAASAVGRNYCYSSLNPETISGGTRISSHLLHVKKQSGAFNPKLQGSVTFSTEILGVIVAGGTLEQSGFLMADNVQYPDPNPNIGLDGHCSDWVSLSSDLRTLTINAGVTFVGDWLDQVRVITDERPLGATIVVRSGNAASGQEDPKVRWHWGDAGYNVFNHVLDAADFEAARNGPQAYVVNADGAWLQDSQDLDDDGSPDRKLRDDPLSEWINMDPSIHVGAGALYAIEFELDGPVQDARLFLTYAVDNLLGTVSAPGVYINEVPVVQPNSATWGSFVLESGLIVPNIAQHLVGGTNTLYLLAQDTGVIAGLIFRAEITIVDCASGIGCTEAPGGHYGRLVFPPQCTEAPGNQPEAYRSATLPIYCDPGARFYVSSSSDRFDPLVADDELRVNGHAVDLGPYTPQPGVTQPSYGVSIECNVTPEPVADVTSLVCGEPFAARATTNLFEIVDTAGALRGNSAVYLVRDCGLMVEQGSETVIEYLSHDVRVLGEAACFDVVTGTLADLRQDQGFASATCLGQFTDQQTGVDSRPDPTPGTGYYYLARGNCSDLTYGTSKSGLNPDPRSTLDSIGPCVMTSCGQVP